MKPAFLIQSTFAALSGLMVVAGLAVPYPKPAPVSVPERTVIQFATPAANDDAAPVPNEPATVSEEATTALAHDAVDPEAVSFQTKHHAFVPSVDSPLLCHVCGEAESSKIHAKTRAVSFDTDQFPDIGKMAPQPAAPLVPVQPVTTQARTVYTTRPTYGRYYQSCGPNGCGPAYGGRRLFRRW